MTDSVIEIFSLLGTPARILGRLPFVTRYIWNGPSRPWRNNEYARTRYGEHYRWRPWLLFDVQDLRVVERLINDGTDQKVLEFHRSQLRNSQNVAVVVSGPNRLAFPILPNLHNPC